MTKSKSTALDKRDKFLTKLRKNYYVNSIDGRARLYKINNSIVNVQTQDFEKRKQYGDRYYWYGILQKTTSHRFWSAKVQGQIIENTQSQNPFVEI